MLYAKVVLGLAVRGPFDYIIPENLYPKIKVGFRVWVNFRNRRQLGYVVEIVSKSAVKNLKNILEIIDDSPILDKNMLALTRELSDYYCCAWGEAIETALPESLRQGKRIPKSPEAELNKPNRASKVILLHDLDGNARWEFYIKHLKDALDKRQASIVVLPDKKSVLKAKEIIQVKLACSLGVLYRKQPKELEEWLKVKSGEVDIVIGTRSSIFAPLNNLGLIIINEEQDNTYKQDQVPHYHAREVAFMRINIQKARLILGSSSPSLESFYLAREDKIKYIFIPRRKEFPEIKIVDIGAQRYRPKEAIEILSKYLQDLAYATLNAKGKVLLFLNRLGFATFAACRNCGLVLKCPRCSINLVYHFKDNILKCHYCNFRTSRVEICPNCNSGYIRYSGVGTEKIESELSRLFPQAKIRRLDSWQDATVKDADIFVSTKSIIQEADYNFDLVGTLFIDNSLNRIDFRASEKTFASLVGLLKLTDKKFVIQTRLPTHHCFRALQGRDTNIFYNEELKQRRQLRFPPYMHFGLVKLRGEREIRVKEISQDLFKKLNESRTREVRDKYKNNIKVVSVNPAVPSKLRGKFCWQILCCANNPKKLSKFLKTHLKDYAHSGIIVTVDIDPL